MQLDCSLVMMTRGHVLCRWSAPRPARGRCSGTAPGSERTCEPVAASRRGCHRARNEVGSLGGGPHPGSQRGSGAGCCTTRSVQRGRPKSRVASDHSEPQDGLGIAGRLRSPRDRRRPQKYQRFYLIIYEYLLVFGRGECTNETE